MTRPTVADIPRMWYRLRVWWHRVLYRVVDITPVDDRAILINCACGGSVQIRRNDDATSTAEYASCPLLNWLHRSRPRQRDLPIARLLP